MCLEKVMALHRNVDLALSQVWLGSPLSFDPLLLPPRSLQYLRTALNPPSTIHRQNSALRQLESAASLSNGSPVILTFTLHNGNQPANVRHAHAHAHTHARIRALRGWRCYESHRRMLIVLRSSNLVIILGFMQISKKIPFDDPNVLNGVRALYILSNVIIAGIYLYVQAQINKKNGASDIHTSWYIVSQHSNCMACALVQLANPFPQT